MRARRPANKFTPDNSSEESNAQTKAQIQAHEQNASASSTSSSQTQSQQVLDFDLSELHIDEHWLQMPAPALSQQDDLLNTTTSTIATATSSDGTPPQPTFALDRLLPVPLASELSSSGNWSLDSGVEAPNLGTIINSQLHNQQQQQQFNNNNNNNIDIEFDDTFVQGESESEHDQQDQQQQETLSRLFQQLG